ncbi:MAG: hypothetical protein ABJH98_07795 [Reichenbachiella sp.]|uniref:hypothetical protein n=1 Tax=Reichenbachiella sp. TaxID=2184521 RepID=UPI00329859D7
MKENKPISSESLKKSIEDYLGNVSVSGDLILKNERPESFHFTASIIGETSEIEIPTKYIRITALHWVKKELYGYVLAGDFPLLRDAVMSKQNPKSNEV